MPEDKPDIEEQSPNEEPADKELPVEKPQVEGSDKLRSRKFRSKDRRICTALDALGHTPEKVERIREGVKPTLFYYFAATAWEDWDKYRRGEELMVSIQAYEQADKRFKNNLYEGDQ